MFYISHAMSMSSGILCFLIPGTRPPTRQGLPYVLGKGFPLNRRCSRESLSTWVQKSPEGAGAHTGERARFLDEKMSRGMLAALAAGYEYVVEIFLLSTRLFHLIRVSLLIEEIDEGLVLAMGRQVDLHLLQALFLKLLKGDAKCVLRFDRGL